MRGRYVANIISLALLAGVGSLAFNYYKATGELPGFLKPYFESELVPPVVEEQATSTKAVSKPQAILATTSVEKKSPSLVVAPGPLYSASSSQSVVGALSVLGTIEETNKARALNGGLPALLHNATLDKDAQMKLDDMFAKQYFEHISPTGVGPATLAQRAGYEYVIVGENLALGDFGADAKLVDAWMNSPGHRANILNTNYEEIGVAVGKGLYEGRTTWLAVQAFGMPLSSCPAIDTEMKKQIDTYNEEITTTRTAVDLKRAQIDSTSPRSPEYNVYVNEYNDLIKPYNILVEKTRELVALYNASVQAFNVCINKAGAN
jgi:uncharacterized protein YkwD